MVHIFIIIFKVLGNYWPPHAQDFFSNCARGEPRANPNILYPDQAQVLHSLPTGERGRGGWNRAAAARSPACSAARMAPGSRRVACTNMGPRPLADKGCRGLLRPATR